MSGEANDTPTNENEPFPSVAGANSECSRLSSASNNCRPLTLARSTSDSTTPNPRVVAAVVVPGTKNRTSVIVLPIAVNRRCGLNASNSAP